MSIKFNNLSYTYMPKTPFEHKALFDINENIKTGEFVAIVGHTGSGKTTLVQHINGLLLPTNGNIKVDDFLIASENKKINTKQLRKHAGMVFQFPEYQLFEETCFKDIAFGPKNYGINEEDFVNKAKEILKVVGLDESFMERSPFELSGGQKRRVAIAGILALEPEILVLDEPTAGLDPRGSKEMMTLFNKINKELNKTVVLVTHDMNHVLEYADKMIILNKGKVVACDTPINIFKDINKVKECHIEQPEIISFASELIKNGLKIDITKVKNIESLADEIKRVKHE